MVAISPGFLGHMSMGPSFRFPGFASFYFFCALPTHFSVSHSAVPSVNALQMEDNVGRQDIMFL